MRSLVKLGFVAVGLGLVVSVAACAVSGEDSGSSNDAFSRGRGGDPRRGPKGVPVVAAEEDAAPPPAELAVVEDPDAAAPAPGAEEDAGPIVIEEDAAAPEPEPQPEPPPPPDEDAGA